MSVQDRLEPVTGGLDRLEKALLEINDIHHVIRIEQFQVSDGSVLVAAKVSLDAELAMQQVSIVVALAERRIRRVVPKAEHIYITPDVYIDQHDAPSTSAIVTLSYD
ncbi:MAG: hypothetical protein ACTJFR_07565 [Canibacter sp.]